MLTFLPSVQGLAKISSLPLGTVVAWLKAAKIGSTTNDLSVTIKGYGTTNNNVSPDVSAIFSCSGKGVLLPATVCKQPGSKAYV